mmetsp:Transcript_22138/g.46962  ORF Transcript_22138/g.46962 Transcript_22138/m.46962 type:complete len:418 (-) Transcript_22138:352-1605(-)
MPPPSCMDYLSRCWFTIARFESPELRRYRVNVLKQLGEGGFGVTYRGEDTLDGTPVACKCLRLSQLVGHAAEEVKREVQLLQGLNHPNIVKIHGAGKRGPDYVIVMEVLVQDLFDIVENSANGLSPGLALRYFRDLLRGVAFCHKQGVLHRDVKLENAMLDQKGRVKLIDFGLACKTKGETDFTGDAPTPAPAASFTHANGDELNSIVGSTSYIAPEVWQRKGSTFESDIWSCGVVLFVMLHKFFPLEQATARDWKFRRLQKLQFLGKRRTLSAMLALYGKSNRLPDQVSDIFDITLSIDPRKRVSAETLLTMTSSFTLAAYTPAWEKVRNVFKLINFYFRDSIDPEMTYRGIEENDDDISFDSENNKILASGGGGAEPLCVNAQPGSLPLEEDSISPCFGHAPNMPVMVRQKARIH